MTVKILCLLFLVVSLGACPGSSPKPVTPMPAVVTDFDKCPAACTNLRSLHCPEGDPIDMHVACKTDFQCTSGQLCLAGSCSTSCEKFCYDSEVAGVFLDPTCVMSITSCSQVESCPGTVAKGTK